MPTQPIPGRDVVVEAPASRQQARGRLATIRDTLGAVVGGLLGLAPHVLHHVGLIAGAALITGVAGNALFFAAGLVLSIPLLRRLHRTFKTWRAPTIAIAVFAAVFSLSAYVIGPAIADNRTGPEDQPPPPSQTPTEDHDRHHSD
jgi:hypothetical protein